MLGYNENEKSYRFFLKSPLNTIFQLRKIFTSDYRNVHAFPVCKISKFNIIVIKLKC